VPLKFDVMKQPDCVCASTSLTLPRETASAPAPMAEAVMNFLRVRCISTSARPDLKPCATRHASFRADLLEPSSKGLQIRADSDHFRRVHHAAVELECRRPTAGWSWRRDRIDLPSRSRALVAVTDRALTGYGLRFDLLRHLLTDSR
jgi:hypothetical protein